MFHKARYLVRKVSKEQADGNIFMTQNEGDSDQLYKFGQLVPYYIVGSTDSFLKVKGGAQKVESIMREPSSQQIPHRPKKTEISQQHEDSCFIKVDMDSSEVEREINLAITHSKQSKPEVNMQERYLSPADKVIVHRENKIMSSYLEQQQKWNRKVLRSAQACNRNPKESIYHHIQAARNKEEDRQILDLIQNDADKYGNKLWEMQLRNQGFEKIKSIEVVRKTDAPYQVYQRPATVQQKFDQKRESVQKLNPCTSVETLQIVGNNQLLKEAAATLYLVKKQSESMPTTKRKKINQSPFVKYIRKEDPLYYPEVIQMQYNKLQLRQQGKLDICKQVF